MQLLTSIPSSATGVRSQPHLSFRCGDDEQALVLHHPPQGGCCASLSLQSTTYGDHGLQGDFQTGPFGSQQACRGNLGFTGCVFQLIALDYRRKNWPRGRWQRRSSSFSNHREAQLRVSWQQLTLLRECTGTIPHGHFICQVATLRRWEEALLSCWLDWAHRQRDICEFLRHILPYMHP